MQTPCQSSAGTEAQLTLLVTLFSAATSFARLAVSTARFFSVFQQSDRAHIVLVLFPHCRHDSSIRLSQKKPKKKNIEQLRIALKIMLRTHGR
jgi:hypothetical protein